MLTRTRLWILGMLCLVGASISGYAYALSCGYGPTEAYEMELISVAYDGVFQVNSPDYAQMSGHLTVYGPGYFVFRVNQQVGATSQQIDEGWYLEN